MRIQEYRETAARSVETFKFQKKRVRVLSKVKDFPDECEGVLYWMSRDQRVQGNVTTVILSLIFSTSDDLY